MGIEDLKFLSAQQLERISTAALARTEQHEQQREAQLTSHLNHLRERVQRDAYLLGDAGVVYGEWEFPDGDDLTADLAAKAKSDALLGQLAIFRERLEGRMQLTIVFSG